MGNFYEDQAYDSLLDSEDYDGLTVSDHGIAQVPNLQKCKYCGETGFQWKNTPNGWRLAKGNTAHECLKAKALAFKKKSTAPRLESIQDINDLLREAAQHDKSIGVSR